MGFSRARVECRNEESVADHVRSLAALAITDCCRQNPSKCP